MGATFMGKKWKNLIGDRKLRFIELYEAGAGNAAIHQELGLCKADIRHWRNTIRVFGKAKFLMSHTTRTQYTYETKLAAVKARTEDCLPVTEVMAKYGIASPKVLRAWCQIYRLQGAAGLQPRQKGRRAIPKDRQPQPLTLEEEQKIQIQRLEAELAVLKKVIALKG
jgi:transposase